MRPAGTRRELFRVLTTALATLGTPRAGPVEPAPAAASVRVPLSACGVGTLCAELELRGGGARSRVQAIVDTGSPFLTVPTGVLCSPPAPYGCADALPPARGLPRTRETYGGLSGEMAWRTASRVSVAAGGAELGTAVLVGAPDLVLERAGGGFFAGLIGRTDDAAHPALLQQLRLAPAAAPRGAARRGAGGGSGARVVAFCLDGGARALTLSAAPLISRSADGAIPLVDLRPFGSPVAHYAARVSDLWLDGARVELDALSRPVVAIFDSGCSSALVSSELVAEAARQRRRAGRRLRPAESWQGLTVAVPTERGAVRTFDGAPAVAIGQLYVAEVESAALFGGGGAADDPAAPPAQQPAPPARPAAERPWPGRLPAPRAAAPRGSAAPPPHFVVLGQAMLSGVVEGAAGGGGPRPRSAERGVGAAETRGGGSARRQRLDRLRAARITVDIEDGRLLVEGEA